MAGKFELYKDKQGKFRFRLKAGNGEIIAVGEAYESKASALNGIDSVRRNAADAKLVDETGS
ncbi:MAG TPA: YegP family protein [Micromonosporaceae bacterium]|nr:YegP family protein [Micromonosporaceae bacterium]